MKFTIAIPYHSGLDYLKRALVSVENLANPDWECLVMDDSKTGEAQALVSQFGTLFRYKHHQGSDGMVENWNACIRDCKTDWVTLLHSDDLLKPNYLDSIQRAMVTFPGAVAYFCGAQVVDQRDRHKFSFPDYVKTWIRPSQKDILLSGESGVFQLLKGAFIFCPTLCYHRPSIERSLFDRSFRMVQDLELQLRLLTAGCEIAGTSEVGYLYRRHDESASFTLSADFSRFDEEINLYENYGKILKNYGFERAAKVAEQKRIIYLHLAYRWVSSLFRLQLRETGRIGKYLWKQLGLGANELAIKN